MKIVIPIFLLFLSFSCIGQVLPEIDLLIKKEMESNKLAALAVAVIDSGKVVHLNARGYKDLEHKVKADTHTSFHIASVSKTVTNLAIFKLVELKKIQLTTDINAYLPFDIQNPHYPNDKITIGDLLNHRSGIKDDYEFYKPFWTIPKGDPTLMLADYLEDYLAVNGEFYKKNHFEDKPAYKSFAYSNTGIALLGLIVEHVSNTSFEDFCQEHIFKPLNMVHTSWFLRNLDLHQVAKTYTYDENNGLENNGQNGYPDYPAGLLRTSIADFSKLWVGYLNAKHGKFILNPQTVNQITPTPSISQEGYYTWFMTAINNHLYYNHGGGDTGVTTTISIDPRNRRGIIIFANSVYDLKPLVNKIEKEMWNK